MGLSKRKWFSSLSRYRLQKTCISDAIYMQQNLVIWLHSFAFDKSSLIYNQVFFSQELSQWIPLGVKGQIRNLSEIFSFDDAILEIMGFEAELHHQKIFFLRKHFRFVKIHIILITIMKAIWNLSEIEKW